MGILTSLIQPSFAAGELSQAVRGRTDLAKYRAGAALLRNFFVQPYGGASTRAGSAVVGRCKQPFGTPPRNIPFEFNTLQAYTLEFGQLYMRVIMNGGYVLEPAKTLIGVTQANPGVFNVNAHGWSAGDQIFITGALGMTAINSTAGLQYLVSIVVDANNVKLTNLDGAAVNTAALPAYTASSGTAARIFTLVTPYAAADLPLLKYTQSADTMTLTHPNYAPMNLTRTQHWAWTLPTITFAAAVQVPTGLAGVGGAATLDYWYIVTAITDTPFEESVGTAAVNVTNVALNSATGVNNTLSWVAPATGPAPNRYSVYRAAQVAHGNGPPTQFGYIGQSTSLAFVDNNIAPDFTKAPPLHTNPFAAANNPACSNYHDGRKVYAAPAAFPETTYLSQSANFNNMDMRNPTLDDDAITITLNSRQVNAIKHLLSMNNALIALTSSGAWTISPGQSSDVLTPASIVAKAQAYNGCSDVPPLAINTDILYVQARGSKVRDLAYNFYVNLYTGQDVSVLANHLFFGFTVKEWTYAEEPFYLIQAVRSDGQILAFTYLKEQDVYAWTHWDTPGNVGTDFYVSLCSIPEGQENAVYQIAARTIPGVNGGAPVYMQERQASRNFYTAGLPDVTKPWCVDCGVQYVGAPTVTMTGADHLNGAMVSILADGGVQAPRLVVNGGFTLDNAASRVTYGLPYVCQLQTLRIDVGEPTIQGKRKKIGRVSLIVQDTRGLQVAPMREDAAGNLAIGQLAAIKERSTEAYNSPTQLRTGIESLVISPQWQVEGAVFIQQSDPLPATVLAVIPTVTVGDDPG